MGVHELGRTNQTNFKRAELASGQTKAMQVKYIFIYFLGKFTFN